MDSGEGKMGLYVDIEKKLNGFNLKVKFCTKDNILGLLGASGSGKSMILRCISGLVTPDTGKIVVNEKILFDSKKRINMPIRNRKVGFLFQNYALFPNMTVSQNIGFALDNMDNNKKMKIVSEKISMMNLSGLENRFPSQLSGGQQQRTAIARALAVEPEILLLDEPFSALDSHLRNKMEEQLVNILDNYSGSTVFVSHNRDEIYRICEDIAVINNGSVDVYGDREYIFKTPQTLSTAVLTGCKNISKIKIIDDTTIEALDWGCTLKVAEKIKDVRSYAAIRAHYISFDDKGDLENTFKCCLNHVIESPFTVSVYLDILGDKTYTRTKSLHLEIEKETWNRLKKKNQPWNIKIPPEKILLLVR